MKFLNENVQEIIGNLVKVQVNDLESAAGLPAHAQATTCEVGMCRERCDGRLALLGQTLVNQREPEVVYSEEHCRGDCTDRQL